MQRLREIGYSIFYECISVDFIERFTIGVLIKFNEKYYKVKWIDIENEQVYIKEIKK